MEPQSRLFVRERARLLVLFPRPFPFQTKKWGQCRENVQSTKPNPASTCRATIFFSGLGQCTKAGAMEPQSRLFVRERARLLVLFPRPFPFQTKKWGQCRENVQSTKPNPASTCRATIFSGLGQCTKAGAMEPQSRLVVREKARLLVLFPTSTLNKNKAGFVVDLSALGECPVLLNLNFLNKFFIVNNFHSPAPPTRAGRILIDAPSAPPDGADPASRGRELAARAYGATDGASGRCELAARADGARRTVRADGASWRRERRRTNRRQRRRVR